MAKVKTAKQKITDYLKAKGLDSGEISDAFRELDEADQDLDQLASQISDATTKNQEWLQWYQKVAPEVQNAFSERDSLKQKLSQLEKAGIQIGDLTPSAQQAAQAAQQGQYVTPDQLDKLKQEMAFATSGIMKSLTKVSLRHFNKFKEELDIDAVEKLVAERGYSVEEAYNQYSKPKWDEAEAATRKEEIDRGIREGVQRELSKGGYSSRRPTKKVDADIDYEPITELSTKKEKAAPSDRELRDAFVADLNSEPN